MAGGSAKIALRNTVASAAKTGCIPPKLWRLTYTQLVPVMRRPNEKQKDITNIFVTFCSCSMKNRSAQVSIGIKKIDKGAKPRTVMAPRMNAQRAGRFVKACAKSGKILEFLINLDFFYQ
jgi:hypothetical protein